jgi:hypothetical protein
MVCSAQTVHLSSIKIVCISKWTKIRYYLQTDQNMLSLEPHHLGVISGASKCTYNNTISKWTEMRFHITHVT